MPAPESIPPRARDARPVLGHVNLMVDTLIANASIDDLRAIVRSTLATTSPPVASAFTAAARHRLAQTNATALPSAFGLFTKKEDGTTVPTQELTNVLSRSRVLYGAGMGLASLGVLGVVVRATVGLRWEEGSSMENILASIDADISQAIQSSREEIEGGRVTDLETARATADDLKLAVKESQRDAQAWGGDFPFERAAASLEFWKI